MDDNVAKCYVIFLRWHTKVKVECNCMIAAPCSPYDVELTPYAWLTPYYQFIFHYAVDRS